MDEYWDPIYCMSPGAQIFGGGGLSPFDPMNSAPMATWCTKKQTHKQQQQRQTERHAVYKGMMTKELNNIHNT